MLATIPYVFQDIYHFETQYTGLAYLGRKSMLFTFALHKIVANINFSWCWHVRKLTSPTVKSTTLNWHRLLLVSW
jgi:hypothetical protein